MTQFLRERVQDRQPLLESEVLPAPDATRRHPASGRLEGRVALITGGDSGIGRSAALLFAREGARVAILHSSEDQDAEEMLGLIQAEGAQGMVIRGDVGDNGFCHNAVDEVAQNWGGLDILVNNVAEQHTNDAFEHASETQIKATFRTNVFGRTFIVQAALRHLSTGGVIVATTSVTADRGQDALFDHSAAQGAVMSFTRALARKLAPRGIRVNGVAPGPISAPLIPASYPPAILFLSCEDSSHMTGHVLHPDGGSQVAG